jgi:D-amino-acid dehydrogenase
MADERCEALVLGAGVVGISTAYALARRGVAVTVVDRAPEAGLGTSFANGGQLSYAYTDALASPALLRKLPALLAMTDPAFRLKPSFDPAFVRWGIELLRNCNAERFMNNTLAGLRLALESRAAMHALLDRHPLKFGHALAGKLHLYEDDASLHAAARMVEAKRAAGAEQEVLTPAEAAKVEPALDAIAGRLSGAVYSPQEEVGDPYLFCTALLRTLQADYGARVRLGAPVSSLDLSGAEPVAVVGGQPIRARHIALCTGVDTPVVLAGTGIRVPIWPMKGYSVTAPLGPAAPNVSITDVSRKLVFCRLSGRMRIAGLADLGTRDLAVDPRRLASLLASAESALPDAANYQAIDSAWSGLRPMTPSSLPVIRKARPGFVLNVGHGALGWTYAMGAGERAADLLLERAP